MSFDLADWLYPDATRERQPQGKLELDEASPLARGLYCYYDPLINRLVNDAGVTSSVNNGQRVIGTRGQAHARIDGYASNISQVLVPGFPASTSDFTLVTLCSVNQSNANAYQVVSTAQSVNAIGVAIETGDGTTKGRIRGRAYIGGTRYVGGSFVILDDDMHLLAFRQRYNVEQALFVDGVKDSVTGAWTGPGIGFSYCGAYAIAPYQKIGLNLWYNRALTDGELRTLADNPWQLFRPRSLGIFAPVAAGGGSTLNASASGSDVASGSASLSAQVALASVGVSAAGGSAALAASVPLSAVGLSVAAGSAIPSATVTISASGLAQAAGQAGLSASVLAQAAGAALASGNATLAAQLNALATGAAQAGGSANLSGGAAGSLSASGAAIAAGTAVLSVTVGLQAAGSALASGTATGSANAPGQVSATGGATAGGSAVASVTASITAAGFVQAMGAGQLTISINLAAFGAALSSGSANLSQPGSGLEPDPKFIIRAAARNYLIKAGPRNYTINRRSS